jgi:hypothetical protein
MYIFFTIKNEFFSFNDKFHLSSQMFSCILHVRIEEVMDVAFDIILDAILGPRKILHIMECPVCGFDEVYYIHLETEEQIGRACTTCSFVQKFEFSNGE